MEVIHHGRREGAGDPDGSHPYSEQLLPVLSLPNISICTKRPELPSAASTQNPDRHKGVGKAYNLSKFQAWAWSEALDGQPKNWGGRTEDSLVLEPRGYRRADPEFGRRSTVMIESQ